MMTYDSTWQQALQNHSPFLGAFALGFGVLVAVVAIWSLFWKGWALWIAARSGSKKWFVVLLILNTLGILEILYIFIFSKKGKMKKMMEPAKPVASDASTNTDATVV